MSQDRYHACIRINEISKDVGELIEKAKDGGMPTDRLVNNLRDIRRQIDDLFWQVDAIKTASDFAEELHRLANAIDGRYGG
jgi:hypothetical protein